MGHSPGKLPGGENPRTSAVAGLDAKASYSRQLASEIGGDDRLFNQAKVIGITQELALAGEQQAVDSEAQGDKSGSRENKSEEDREKAGHDVDHQVQRNHDEQPGDRHVQRFFPMSINRRAFRSFERPDDDRDDVGKTAKELVIVDAERALPKCRGFFDLQQLSEFGLGIHNGVVGLMRP